MAIGRERLKGRGNDMGHSIIRGSLAAVSAALLSACSQGGGAPAAIPATPALDVGHEADAIRAIETQWNADWAARDPARIAAHYAPDATVMPPGIAAMHGPDEIIAGLRQVLGDRNFSITFAADRVVVAASGDVAYTSGDYTEHDSVPHSSRVATSTGRYVTTYRRVDGHWLAVDDINTPGAPAAAASGPAAASAAAR
jgi:uncharacterized protein (TIGR02246 family)